MSVLKTPSMEDLVHIKQSYADVVKCFRDVTTSGKTLSEIQDALNENAKRIYDKFGRIIIKVGPEASDYLDITSPRASFNLDTVMVNFMQTNSTGVPLQI